MIKSQLKIIAGGRGGFGQGGAISNAIFSNKTVAVNQNSGIFAAKN
jgi:hypothetical protein